MTSQAVQLTHGGTNDRRLEALAESITDPRTAVVSVDCFDTILWRRTARPTDVFVVLGEELRDAGHLAKGIDPRAFCQMRAAAEVLGRRHNRRRHNHLTRDTGEVSLEEIYAQLPAYVSDLSSEELRAHEVALEARLSEPDFTFCAELSRLAANLDLIVVSDTYLTATELATLLDKPGYGDLRNARIFTSCEFGTGKGAHLWAMLPDMLGVAPDQIVHIGNNEHADFRQPTALGIRALHWPEFSEELPEVLAREVDFRVDGERDAGADHGVTALRGRARFSSYTGPAECESYWQVGVEILGPVMVGYADWVYERTAELGIDRAICVMREGHFFQELLDAGVGASPNPGLRNRLMWASRTALARVLLAGADRDEITKTLTTPRPASIAGAADLLGLSLDRFPDFKQLSQQAPHLAEDPGALKLFLDAVWATPGALDEIQATALRRRDNFLRHVRDVLGDEPGDVAMCDIGWQGSNQERLQEILDRAGFNIRLHGFYTSADTTPLDRLLRGHRIEGFIPGRPVASDGRQTAFFRNRVMLETLFLSGGGTTLEIDDHGQPVLGANVPPASQVAQTRAVQQGILAYRDHIAAYRTAGADDVGRLAGRDARTLIERFVTAPTRGEAELFGPIVHDDSHSNMELLSLIPTGDTWARRLSSAQLNDERWERVWWAAGATARWHQSALRGAPPDLSPAGAMRVQMHRVGQHQPDERITICRVGVDGTMIGLLRASGDDLHRLQLFPAIVSGLLRLDKLQVFIATPSNGWRKPVWTWTAGDDPNSLTLLNCSWLSATIINLGSGSALELTLDSPLPAPSQFELEMQAGFLSAIDGSARLVSLASGNATVKFEPTATGAFV
jgi:FMN phosphatase YigB (HAD superfamily)